MEIKAIGPRHPLYGCDRAWFTFLIQTREARVLTVEAKNRWAVGFMEMISRSGRVSPTCALLTVHTGRAAMTSQVVEIMKLSDFAIDMIDYNGIAGDPAAVMMLQKALSDADRYHMERRLNALDKMRHECRKEEVSGLNFLEEAESETLPAASDCQSATRDAEMNAEKIMAAMTDLGFGKSQIKRFIDGIGPRLGTDSLETLIREGIRELGA